ncbi:hypothetical protein NQ314_004904 [Rhamnusium bicolor]|uniref:DDE Tnp4 domain-containing protein n=1 Tax=Rhamnusium bicolor TaxID=1586634 RepID=A0AAV8ZKL0_9CUCU|nr:hypothetical protein NQ314_004904 [Rhamnusium bicolor]
MDLPNPSRLPKNGPVLSYVLVGDEAFQLTSYMMRPYPRVKEGSLTLAKRIFNYRLCRARRGTVCLHNFIKKNEDLLPTIRRRYCHCNIVNTEDGAGQWRNDVPTESFYIISNTRSNAYKKQANVNRQQFTEYFNDEGAVSWQIEKINHPDF